MFRNIFQRLLVTYLLLALIIISGLSLAISVGYSHYFFSEKEETLKSVAEKAKQLSISYENGEIGQDTLNTSIDALGDSTNSLIYILKIKNKDIPSNGKPVITGFNDKVILKDIINIINGQQVFKKKQYSEAFDMDVLLIGYPIRFDSETRGAVLLMHPLDNINKYIHEINMYIWLLALLAFLFCVPLIYFHSSKISRPIAIIERDARRIADGESFETTIFNSRDEIGRLSKSFHHMKAEIERAERVRRELIANISHELRTPLTSINGFAQGMIDGIVPEDQQRNYLGIIKEESERLIGLTSEILELAKLQSGNIKLNISQLNLKEEFNKTIGSMNLSIPGKEVEISNLVGGNLNVKADKDRLKQILMNILSNSMTYADGKVIIVIDAEKEDSFIRVSVRDNGPGINETELPYIFDKFYRSGSSGFRSEGGAGLGLSVVKELISALGGSSRADKNPSGGLIISFTLPACSEQSRRMDI